MLWRASLGDVMGFDEGVPWGGCEGLYGGVGFNGAIGFKWDPSSSMSWMTISRNSWCLMLWVLYTHSFDARGMRGIFWEPPWYLEGVLLWGEANESGGWDEVVYTFVRALGADSQQSMFKMPMKSNSKATMLLPYDMNPLTYSWRTVNASRLLTHFIAEYVKLAEIAVVHVLGCVEDEGCFFKAWAS